MSEHVCVKMTFTGKLFTTLKTLKVFNTSVSEHVFVKITYTGNFFTTLKTLKVFNASVNENVFIKITFKPLPTFLTLIVSLTSTDEDMLSKTAFQVIYFCTLVALKASHIRVVGEHVVPEISHTSAHRPTLVTPHPCPASMGKDVSGKGSLTGAHFPAVVTRVGSHGRGRLLLPVPAVPAGARPRVRHCNTTFAEATQSNSTQQTHTQEVIQDAHNVTPIHMKPCNTSCYL